MTTKLPALLRRIRFAPLSRFADVLVARPRFVWGALLLPALVIAECVAVSVNNGWSPEGALKAAGFLIGLSGLLLVAFGLWRTRNLFGRPPLRSQIRAWGREVVALFVAPPARTVIGHSVINEFGSDSAVMTGAVLPTTLDERVAALERRAAAAEKRIEEVRLDACRMVEEARAELRADDDSLRASVTEVGKRLEDFSVGGLDLEFMGLIWLIVGSMLSTFYGGIASCPVWQAFM